MQPWRIGKKRKRDAYKRQELVRIGYVQTMQGKGVRNIFEPAQQATFTLGTIESFAESAARNHWRGTSEILLFSELTANAALAAKTGFDEGTPLYYIQRLHLSLIHI